jgi:hypothetical protein
MAMLALLLFPAVTLSRNPTFIPEEALTPEEVEQRDERRREAREAREERQKELMGDYWLRIEPGLIVSSTTVEISGVGGDGTLANQRFLDTPEWMFDVTSPSFRISEHFGVNVLLHTRAFDLQYQLTGDQFFETGDVGREVRDLGTRVRGYYSTIAPVLYYDTDGREGGFRAGFGPGTSYVEMQGRAAIGNNPLTPALFESASRNEFLAALQTTNLISSDFNLSQSDPVYTALLLGLRQPGGLERMGAYLLFRGDVQADPATILLVEGLTNSTISPQLGLNTLEAIAAAGLFGLNLDIVRDGAPSFFLFAEYSWDQAALRLSFGGPQFSSRGYDYTINSVLLSLSFPIRF